MHALLVGTEAAAAAARPLCKCVAMPTQAMHQVPICPADPPAHCTLLSALAAVALPRLQQVVLRVEACSGAAHAQQPHMHHPKP